MEYKIRNISGNIRSKGFTCGSSEHILLHTMDKFIEFVALVDGRSIKKANKLYSEPQSCIFNTYCANNGRTTPYFVSLCLICGRDLVNSSNQLDSGRWSHIKHFHNFDHDSKHALADNYALQCEQHPIYMPCKKMDTAGFNVPKFVRLLLFYSVNDFSCVFCGNDYGVVPSTEVIVSHLKKCSYIKHELENPSERWNLIEKIE